MMRGLAVEYARNGIRANAIVPGWIDTPMTEDVLQWEKFQEKVLTRIPVRRWGQPEDFGGLAVYLASSASTFHTGDTIVIDGGYSVY
ncbi:MAG: SDR family NAD(P)-dependent oxidoreductase, partial [Acidimicrobiia bacterium]